MERNLNDKNDNKIDYSIADFPKELNKKVTLLKHFKS